MVRGASGDEWRNSFGLRVQSALHSAGAEDSSFVGYDAMSSSKWLLMFLTKVEYPY